MRSLNDQRFIYWARFTGKPEPTLCVYCGREIRECMPFADPPVCSDHDDLPALDPYYQT